MHYVALVDVGLLVICFLGCLKYIFNVLKNMVLLQVGLKWLLQASALLLLQRYKLLLTHKMSRIVLLYFAML